MLLIITSTVTEIQQLISQKSQILPTPSHLVPSFEFQIYGKALRFLKLESFRQTRGEDLVIISCTVFD